jgi:hypothetical protein
VKIGDIDHRRASGARAHRFKRPTRSRRHLVHLGDLGIQHRGIVWDWGYVSRPT